MDIKTDTTLNIDTNIVSGCETGCACSDNKNSGSSIQINRRGFIGAVGITPLALLASSMPIPMPVMAGPFHPGEANSLLQSEDKRLDPAWVKSLTDRGKPTLYSGKDLSYIGMPIGGIGAGQMYLGGDGKLWHWDVFNIPHGTGDGGYAHPRVPSSPLEQGFALRVVSPQDKVITRKLDKTGFQSVNFTGQYPIGTIDYSDSGCPVSVRLEAFSPFIPLNADDSSLPCTFLNYTITNSSKDSIELDVFGWLENATVKFSDNASGVHVNQIVKSATKKLSVLTCSAEPDTSPAQAKKPDRLVEDWNRDSYGTWRAEGTAFGKGPIKKSAIPDYQGDVGGDTERVVNSHATAPGANVVLKDGAIGKLISAPFLIDRNFLKFWLGGGSHEMRTCLNVIVNGKVVRTAVGRDNNKMDLRSVDLRPWANQQATIEIVDEDTGAWGNIGVGRIFLSDAATVTKKFEDLPDNGTLMLGLIGENADLMSTDSSNPNFSVEPDKSSKPVGVELQGSIGKRLQLKPGESKTVAFFVAWYFPNLTIDGLGKVGRHYAARFPTPAALTTFIEANYARLTRETRLWRDTWYDSTLPYWFLDRTIINISTLSTGACYRLANGRFYAWEGVGCCPGTCTHVWHYAQAMARLFPELERDIRERIDFGIAYHPDTGVMGFRAEFDTSMAVDGQTGTLLRAYREHLMSPDDAFLRKNWPRIKGAYEPLFQLDANNDGVLEGGQMNTLDQQWFGKVSWLSSLYVAAVRSGEAMATEMNDVAFASKCKKIADAGSKNIDAALFNGEYYIQLPDPAHTKAVGSYNGCEIDQISGASWADQVGLTGVLPTEHVKSALKSIWKYSFLMDVGPYRETHKPGRWYALAGEAGLLMCSWPQGDAARSSGGFDFYLNECMSGFEYQAAGHMVRRGMVTEGLAATRAIHDRYHGSKRNPWNEVECGDHYTRAMASFGVYLSALGYNYHGPKGALTLSPRWGSKAFRAAITTAEGWGSFELKFEGGSVRSSITVKWGSLRLRTITILVPSEAKIKSVSVLLDGRRATISQWKLVSNVEIGEGASMHLTISLPETVIRAGKKLEIRAS